MTAGSFASYHVYPNYPDFMYLEGTYEEYLRRLKRYHGHQPLLVAEFGVSTSRGIAHVTPSGLNHGGHDETEQGTLIADMLRSIRASGCAGGIVFEFMDEWFKGTWSVAPLELPGAAATLTGTGFLGAARTSIQPMRRPLAAGTTRSTSLSEYLLALMT